MYKAGMHDSWTHAGILKAVRKLVRESNSLFEDMAKKVKDEDGQAAISNRIFEIWFYNLFIAQDAIDSKTYDARQQLKRQFVTESGLDVEKILKK